VGGYPIFKEAWENLRERRMTMELSMTLALVAALVVGETFTALVIAVFVLVAEILEGLTVGRGRRAIHELLDFLPRTVMVVLLGCVDDRIAGGGSAALPLAAHANGGSKRDAHGNLDTVDDGAGKQACAPQWSHARRVARAGRRASVPEALRAGVLPPVRRGGLGRRPGASIDQRSGRGSRAGSASVVTERWKGTPVQGAA
jgi:hypothetical protein